MPQLKPCIHSTWGDNSAQKPYQVEPVEQLVADVGGDAHVRRPHTCVRQDLRRLVLRTAQQVGQAQMRS